MKQPNIIVIFADDLGYGDLQCYGSEVNRTPRLDQMAREGVRFTDFYVPAAVCTPSRAGLMTGCYPRRVGLDRATPEHAVLFPGDPVGLNPDEVTIADVLKQAGYATAIVGKWHLGDQPEFLPTNHGFDESFGLPYSNDMLPAHPQNHRYHFPPLPLMRGKDVFELDPDQVSLTDRFMVESLDFIRRQAQAEKPFFLYLAHTYTHLPLYAPYKYVARSKNGAYGAAVEHLDATTGVLLDTLGELGIDDNTLVVFTSDNGSNGRNGGSNAPLRGTKGMIQEGGMRMPCIMRWPGQLPAGTTCSQLATTMDLLPTFAWMANTRPPEDRKIDGRDIAPLMRDPEHSGSPHEAFAYYKNHGQIGAMRMGRWKLYPDSKELFDVREDLGEAINVYDQHPGIVKQITQHIQTLRQDLGDEKLGIPGPGCRPVGRVANAKPLSNIDHYDPAVRALYDMDDD